MSPLDTHLHDTLAQHAADVEAPADLLRRVERRAQTMHRRRVALATTGTAAVTALAIVGGLTLTGDQTHDAVKVPIANPGGTPSAALPTLPPSPTPTATPGSSSGQTPVTSWPMAGSIATGWVTWGAVVRSLRTQVPADFLPLGDPRAIGATDTDGGEVVVFTVPAAGDRLVAAAVLQSAPGTAVGAHDIASDGNVPWVGVIVPVQTTSGTVDNGIVVGPPTTGQILFKLPGESKFRPVEGTDPRIAAVTLPHVEPGQPVAQVRVLSGDGIDDSSAYSGPIQQGVTFPDV